MRSSLAACLDEFPLYPLSQAVLFPGVVLPLQIDSPPGCRMVADSWAGHRLWLVCMIRADVAQDNKPPLHPVGCLSRLVHCEQQPGGRFDVWVQGMRRAKLTCEVPVAAGYRCARAEIPPPPQMSMLPLQSALWARLHRCVATFVQSVQAADPELASILCEARQPLELLDMLSTLLVPDPLVQQALLQQFDLRARLQMLIECVELALQRLNGNLPARPWGH